MENIKFVVTFMGEEVFESEQDAYETIVNSIEKLYPNSSVSVSLLSSESIL